MLALSEQVTEDALFILQEHIRELVEPFAPNYTDVDLDADSVLSLEAASEQLVVCGRVGRGLLDQQIPVDDGVVDLLEKCAASWARCIKADRGSGSQSEEERTQRAEDVAHDECQLVKVRVLQRLVSDARGLWQGARWRSRSCQTEQVDEEEATRAAWIIIGDGYRKALETPGLSAEDRGLILRQIGRCDRIAKRRRLGVIEGGDV